MSLTYKRQNAFKSASPEELKKIFDYNEGYKKYLDNGKTERETVTETIEMAKANGYTEYTLGDKINPGDKLYYNNRGKALFIIKAGKADLAKNGVRAGSARREWEVECENIGDALPRLVVLQELIS